MHVSIHVDDMVVVAATNDSMITSFEEQMSQVIVLKDLGNLPSW